MGGYQRRRSKRGGVTIDFARLQAVTTTTLERALTQEEQKVLVTAGQLLERLVTPPFRNDESTGAVLGDDTGGEGQTQDDSDGDGEAKPRAPGHGRKKPSDYPGARHQEVKHPTLKHGDPCPCGCGGRVYRIKRPKVFREFVGRPPIEVTIYEMEELRCGVCEKHYPAPLPEGVGPEPYHPTAVSVLALARYGTGIPMYRQAAFLGCLGVPIAVATQYEVMAAAAKKIEPVYEELIKVGAQGKVGHFDDTRMTILDFVRPKEDPRTGIHTTGVLSVHEAFQIALFFTGRNHAGENMAELLKMRDPDLPAMLRMSDALACNFSEVETEEDVLAACMAHGRRGFVKVAENFPVESRKILTAIGTIYHHDKLAKQDGLSPEQRLSFHQANSKPVMDDLNVWLNSQLHEEKTVEPNSTLGKAMKYMLNHWERLTLFLRVAGAPLDNNICERMLKKAVLHRKNSLFYRTVKGAKTGDIYMSLIYTCQINGVNAFDYLTELLRNADHLKLSPGDWLPWTYQATIQRLRASQPPS